MKRMKTHIREPNGRLQREREHSPTHIRRLRDAALRGLRDAEWGTELGRLYLERTITDVQYGAGKRWREQAAAYRSSIGVFPIRTAKLERGAVSMAPDPDSAEGQAQAVRDGEAQEEFFAAHSALLRAGGEAEAVVQHVCEDDRALCGMAEYQALRKGLDALSAHYGLTKPEK